MTTANNIFNQNTAILRQCLQQLGAQYGVKGASEFVKVLLSTSTQYEGLPLPPASEVSGQISGEGSALEALSAALLSLNGEGIFIEEFSDVFDNYVGTAGPGAEDPLVKNFSSAKECPISLTFPNAALSGKAWSRDASVKTIIDVKEDIPEKGSGGISVIEMHHPALGFANKDSNAAAIMLQSIPSIEISKCVPYFDCKIITKGAPLVTNAKELPRDNTTTFSNGISIYKFLHGEKIEKQDKFVTNLVSFIPSELATPEPDLSGGVTDPNAVPPSAPAPLYPDISVAGMEVFTSPQTMVNGELVYEDLDTSDLNYGTGKDVRDIPLENKVLDKFRPFMTFKSMNVVTTPATGMLATKSAEVKIKLHDRSRMNYIAPLIAPAKVKDVEFLIEWGWSHPVSDPNINPYGALLNSTRVKEKYGLSNSSYSFTSDGQVDITLKLYTKGAQNATFDLISTDKFNRHPMDTLQDLITSIREGLRTLQKQGYTFNEEMGAPDVLGKMTSVKGLMTLDDKQKKEINDFLLNMRKKASASAKENWTKLSASWESAKRGLGGYQAALQKQFGHSLDVIAGKEMSKLSADPYLLHCCAPIGGDKAGTYVNVKSDTHVSLAKVLLRFVALPLMETGRFDEVQLVFYPMNEFAMYARELNVGQYPLNKQTLKDWLLKSLSRTPSMTIQRFLNTIRTLFMSNSGDDIYGMSQFFEKDKVGKGILRKSITEGDNAKKEKAKMANTKQKVMEDCYGKEGEKRFKKPAIQMFVECVKHGSDPSKTILRLHFYDRQATSYSGYAQLWQAASGNDLGIIGKYVNSANRLSKDKAKLLPPKATDKERADHEKLVDERQLRTTKYEEMAKLQMDEFMKLGLIDDFKVTGQYSDDNLAGTAIKYRIKGGPDQLRGILARNMPTLKYGTEYSGILNASLSTQSNPQMETIHMTRSQTRGAKPGASQRDSGLPLQVKPVTLSIDTFGCPFINFGQQYFVDFMTNTSVDDIYAVSKVDHDITPDSFKTSIQLQPLSKMGQFRSLVDGFDEATEIMKDTANRMGDEDT